MAETPYQASSWIIPAYAGSTHTPRRSRRRRRDHPRIRGEHAPGQAPLEKMQGSSPHTRGARSTPTDPASETGIIPAYAGSTRLWSMRPTGRAGSSPHTRGARQAILHVSSLARIIPAYAGSTPIRLRPSGCRRDHPRIRGEHIDRWDDRVQALGSSPHTRGARVSDLRYGRRRRIIPAYAGSTFLGGRRIVRLGDHPRIRGEHDAESPA